MGFVQNPLHNFSDHFEGAILRTLNSVTFFGVICPCQKLAMAWHGAVGKNISVPSLRDEEFEEENMWGFARERYDSSPKNMKKSKEHFSGSSSSSAWRLPSTPKMIPRANSSATPEVNMVKQSSAPLDIPDWSKIYGKNAKMDAWVNDGDSNGNDVVSRGMKYYHGMNDVDDDDGDNDEDEMVPPHEYIAKRLARTQISSFSVCEGVGRTLKGRDLSKVRNAILTKTGFLE